MWTVPGCLDDVVVVILNGGNPIFTEQLTKLRSLETRNTIVAKGDGTRGLSALRGALAVAVAVVRGSVGEGEGREGGECVWDIVFDGTTECLKACGVSAGRDQSHQHHRRHHHSRYT